MSYITAKNVVLLINNGTDYVPHVCAVSFSIKTTSETKDVLTVGDGNWSKPKVQRKAYTMTFEGVAPYDRNPTTGYDPFLFIEHQCTDVDFEYKVIYYESDNSTVVKMFTGEALVIDSDLSANAEDFMSSSFTCAGFGAYQRWDSASACNATLASVAYSSQGLFVVFNYNGLVGSDRLEYSVDGTTRRALVDMSSSGQIVIMTGVGVVPGAHTLEVWPVCANGDDGTSVITNYTKT